MTVNNLATLKRLVVEHLLGEHPQILVACAIHHPGTRVPSRFNDADAITLVWGMNLPTPIKDLRTDEHGLSGTLRFGREPHFCVVPWEAVICVALEDGAEPVVGFPVQRPQPTSKPIGGSVMKLSRQRRAPPKLQLLRGGASAVPVVDIGRRKPPAEGPQTA